MLLVGDNNKIHVGVSAATEIKWTWKYFSRHVNSLQFTQWLAGAVNEWDTNQQYWLIAQHELGCQVIDHANALLVALSLLQTQPYIMHALKIMHVSL